MGSSSSKPRYDYPGYGYSSPPHAVDTGSYPKYPAQGQPAGNPQYGYFMKQVGVDHSQVQAVPGYYYPVDRDPGRQSSRRHKRNNSVFIPPAPPVPRVPVFVSATEEPQAVPARDGIRAPMATEPTPATDTLITKVENPSGVPVAEANSSDKAPERPSVVDNTTPPEAANTHASQPETETAPAPVPPAAGLAETSTSRERLPEDHPLRVNPLPEPPRKIISTEKYRDLPGTRAAKGTRGHHAPAASGTTKGEVHVYYKPKASTLKPPIPHEEILGKRTKNRKPATVATLPIPPPSRPPVRARKASADIARGPPTTESNGIFKKTLRSFTLPLLSGNKRKERVRRPLPSATLPAPRTQRVSTPRYIRQMTQPPAPPYESRTVFTEEPAFIPHQLPPYAGPPITIPLHSHLNPTSPHKVLYKKKLYPTAAHLWDAHKFLKYDPDVAERIRTTSDTVEMSRLSWAFQMQGYVREDWELVWRDKLDEVLYMKFVQHPDLRAELMATGYALLLDGNEMSYRDMSQIHDPTVNELGKALIRLRERLRREGAR